MSSFSSLRAKTLISLTLILTFMLAACGTSGNQPTTGGNTGSAGGGTAAPAKGTITVASKLDVESQLVTKMYALLLHKAGFTVNEKPALGNSTFIFSAIKSGNIDLYPEFTATGLNALNIPSTYDPQKDYQAVKDAFNTQFQITWLDMAPLNDGYGLCTSQSEAQSLGVTNISQLAPKASGLVLVSPSDGTSFVDGLKTTYNLTTKSFKKTTTVDYALGFQAVSSNQAQITVCYTTDGSVKTKNFVFLDDDKHGFPEFHPAPIVRNEVLQKNPDIANILNPLAPDLTTDVSIDLQGQVAKLKDSGSSVSQAITQVATTFLQSKGLL